MRRWWSGIWRDTLFKRLFLLMWVALVASHLLAFNITMRVHAPPGAQSVGPMPMLAALPPMGERPGPARADRPPSDRPDGGPDAPAGPPPGPAPGAAPPDRGTDAAGGPGPGPTPDAGPGGPGGALPAAALWLDLSIRFAAIGVAAWFGARWLSAPMRRLAEASEGLGRALGRERPLPTLDEHSGTHEVRQTAHVFNAMAQQLRAEFEAQSLLMAAISHDLRTPLARLRLRLETMEAQPQTPRCVADVQEMDQMIGSVLEMLRSSHTNAARQRVDLGAVVQSLVDDLAAEAQAVSGAAEMPQAVVMAEPAALKRMLDNLVGNALRYGSSAHLALTVRDAHAHVAVDDTGPGIAPEQLTRVFEPFYRIESSRNRSTGGGGLGLYIARDLAQRAGGQLTLQNRPEGGLRAELVLPLAL